MKIVEHTSTHLILKDSPISLWATALACTPFLLGGCVSILLMISLIIEGEIPSLQGLLVTIFFVYIGLIGVFGTSRKILLIDKNQNKLTVKSERILGNQSIEFPLNQSSVRVKETCMRGSLSTSFLSTRRHETIYVVVIETACSSQKIHLTGNYGFNRNKAIEIGELICAFLPTPLGGLGQ